MRVVTFKMEEELLDELDRYASSLGLTRSDVIRRAIIELLRGSKETPRRMKFRIRKVVVY